jgi:hypothetical protein
MDAVRASNFVLGLTFSDVSKALNNALPWLTLLVATFTMVALIAAALIGYRTLAASAKSLEQSERSQRFGVYTKVMDLLEAPSPREGWHIVRDLSKGDTTWNSQIEDLDEDKLKKVDGFARELDKVGLLVKHGVVPLNFVLDYDSRVIVVGWNRLQERIKDQRERHGQPGHRLKFQELAYYAKLQRDKQYPGQETFQLTPNDRPPEWSEIWYTSVAPVWWQKGPRAVAEAPSRQHAQAALRTTSGSRDQQDGSGAAAEATTPPRTGDPPG